MEAWREELYHHGIKGQRWGIRRYQNKDGSLTEAGKKRIVKNIQQNRDTLFIPGKNDGPMDKDAYDAVRSSIYSKHGEKIQKLLDELDDSTKEFRDFDSNGEVRNKYETIAGCAQALRYGADPSTKNGRAEIAGSVWGYRFEDLDQGPGNAFDLYLLDKGISPKECLDRYDNARDAYLKETENAASDILGSYGDTPIPSYAYGLNATAKKIVANTMEDRDSRWAYMGIISTSKSEEKSYKSLLNQAKKIYKDYENLSDEELTKWSNEYEYN